MLKLGYSAKVLADSVSETGARLTTLEVTLPRFVLAEFNTHRVFSRNSASSRAIRVSVNIRRILESPYIPFRFGKNQAGMQSSEHITPEDPAYKMAVNYWLNARDSAIISVVGLLCGGRIAGELQLDFDKTGKINKQRVLEILDEYDERLRNQNLLPEYLNVHKQLANRLIENWVWQTIIVTSTEWSNYLALRTHFDAQDEINIPAHKVADALASSTPTLLKEGEWHLPLIQPDEKEHIHEDIDHWIKVSIGRCARCSYLTHHGVRDTSADVRLFDRLVTGGHMSPLEHVATPLTDNEEWSGNFRGWEQYRKRFANEDDYSKILAQ